MKQKSKWKLERLGNVCLLTGGGTPAKSNQEFYLGEIPWATVRDMKNEIISTTECQITEEAVKNSSTNVIQKGNVVIATRVGLGKICMLAQDTAINQDLRGIIPKDDNQIVVRFLFWWLRSIAHIIKDAGTGATVQGVKVTFVSALEIPIPSLSEQKRIVAILDEVFAGIDDAIANTEKNLTNARDLFESYLNEVFTHKDQKWMEKELSEIVEPDCSLSYGIVQPGEEYEKGLPIVRPTDLKTKIIILKELKRIDPLLAESYKRTQMQGGELLLCVRGSTGMVGLAADELTGGNVTRGIVPIRFKKSNVLQSFGYYALISKPVQDQITEKTYGAALMQINIRDVRKISIAFPTKIEEQQLLLENLGLVEEKTQRLEAIYQQKLTALNELKQSILQKAFTGELTADATSQAEKVKEEIAA